MLREILIAVAAAALLCACSSGVTRTVDHSAADVQTMIQSNERSLNLTHYLPTVDHAAENTADGRIWRFTLDGRDYARMVITIEPKSAVQTEVTGRFEEVNDAEGTILPFLRNTARATSEEILAASLEGRPIDSTKLQDQIKVAALQDPGSMAKGYMEETARMFNEVQNSSASLSPGSSGPGRGSQPYDKRQPYDKTPAYDRN